MFLFSKKTAHLNKDLKMADLNKDGIIDVRDVTELQKNISK
ncbi:hypothetical protein [Ruminococcus sp.]|jgi:hypothetical protein